MKIKTIDNEEINTDNLRDDKAQLIEMIEKSGIRDFVVERNGCCLVWARLSDGGWSSMHFKNGDDLSYLLHLVNEIVEMATKKAFSARFVKNDDSGFICDRITDKKE